MKFISHLDLLRTFIRALRRAGIPVAYSQGFNPVPRLTFAAPLAVGMEGRNEYLDFFLNDSRKEGELKNSFNQQLPPGLKVKEIKKAGANQPTISSLIGAALYVANLSVAPAVSPRGLLPALAGILQKNTILRLRRDRKSVKKVDIRPFIYDLKVKGFGGTEALLMLLATGSKGGARPGEVLDLLPLDGNPEIYRQDLFIWEESGLKTPAGLYPDSYLG